MQNKNIQENSEDLNKNLDAELDLTDQVHLGNVDDDSDNNLSTKDSNTHNKEDEKEYNSEYIKTQLQKIQGQISQLLKHIDGEIIPSEKIEEPSNTEDIKLNQFESGGEQIIEGIFTGEEMIGPDGKRYSIPSNYASKSKLVEGDILKLIIKRDGTFVYKQIGPIERRRLVGSLIKNDETSQHYVIVDGKKWKVLKASVTFFKGDIGDETIILIPRDSKSKWAAIENIVRINN